MPDATRQYGTLEQIRPDHVERYKFAARHLQKGLKVLDLACGCGYGSWIMHKAGLEVTGADIEPEAISYARENYPGPAYLNQAAEETRGPYDALVSFETLEHLEDPGLVLRSIQAPLVLASVPNEERYPFSAERFAGDKYPHKRHYTSAQFKQLLNDSGYAVQSVWCQKGKASKVESGTDGMFLIYVGRLIGPSLSGG